MARGAVRGAVNNPPSLFTRPIHLGRGAIAAAQPEFTGMDWYADYSERTAEDGTEGRLVSMYRFEEDWDNWEVHPSGHEVVLCTEGEITLIQQHPDGRETEVTLGPGDYAINDPGVWHTADIASSATAIFITAGQGTEHKPR